MPPLGTLVGEGLNLPLHTPSALLELPLRIFLRVTFLRGPLVFFPELLPRTIQLLLPPERPVTPQDEKEQQQDDQDQDHQPNSRC